MYCKNCGTKNKDDARFCANCGQKLIEDQPEKKMEPIQNEPEPQYVDDHTKQVPKNWIIIGACVVIIAAAGIFGYQYSKSKNQKEAKATTEETTAKTTQKATEENTGADVADTKEETTSNSQALPYTDNKKKNLKACKNPDNYVSMTSKDKSFSFMYPKYLFNQSSESEDGNEYILEHTTGDGGDWDYKVTITKQATIYENDPVASAQEMGQRYKSGMRSLKYEFPDNRAPKIYDGDKATMIEKGYLDDARTQYQYLMATSDNVNMYTLVIEYNDSNANNDYKAEDYVADCMYRGCSFANTSKAIRSFKAFKVDKEDKDL